MSAAAWQEPAPARARWWLAACTLACLLPFLGKAFHMDDPLFIWTARHIQSRPLDFYGFSVNWGYAEMPMTTNMQNPPLSSYYLALVGTLLGWSENALHFGFLAPALALILGTYELARKLCARPFFAALATLATPVFLLSSTSVMCDTMMAAFWVWAVYLWVSGLENRMHGRLLLAVVFVSASGLTKYFGFALVPLLAAHSLFMVRKLGWWLAYLAVPLLVMGVFEWWTARLYGNGLLSNAANYVANLSVSSGAYAKTVTTLSFCGGCLIIALAALPWLWGRRGLVIALTGIVLTAGILVLKGRLGEFAIVDGGHVRWPCLVQLAVFVVGGIAVAWLAVVGELQNRSADSMLLLLWIAGVMTFVGALNWTVAGRNILPMAPAVAILVVRQLERRGISPRSYAWPLGISAALALLVTWADAQAAGTQRDAANSLTTQLKPKFATVSFEGHWGFQYYMEQLGAKSLSRYPLVLETNQVVVIPMENTCIFRLPQTQVEPFATLQVTPVKWLTLQSLSLGAGYYSDAWGPAPFLFGKTAAETYWVIRTTQH